MSPKDSDDRQPAVTPIDITISINGRNYTVTVESRKTLADTIREDCGLTGTHLGCEQGVCGACTVLLDGQPVRSCLMFAVQANKREVRTVEGLAPSNTELHPVQQAFIDHHALQCGFCTPGFLMLATFIYESHPHVGEEKLLELLSSNLCRCTGYLNILKAVQAILDSPKDSSHKTLNTERRSSR